MMTYYLHNNGMIREGSTCPGEGSYCNPRPVVVIDPEDREQVGRIEAEMARLCHWARGDSFSPARTVALQAALRSLIEPPKPPEPTGLGAVVEDAEDRRWVRNESRDDCPWRCAVDLCWLPYSEINAVRVLSEGIS